MADPLEELYKQYKDAIYRFFLRSTMDSHRAQQVDFTTLDVRDSQNDYKAFDEQMLIQEVLNNMEENERTFILLRDFQEFTYAEIAEILALSEGQVKIGIYRARKKFTSMYHKQEEGNV